MYLVCRLLLRRSHAALSPLSLHDALPILAAALLAPDEFAGLAFDALGRAFLVDEGTLEHVGLLDIDVLVIRQHRARRKPHQRRHQPGRAVDRKSTRLNSSHRCISYAVFCYVAPTPRSPPFPSTTLFRSWRLPCSRQMNSPALHSMPLAGPSLSMREPSST